MRILKTIGHSNHTAEFFFALLEREEISAVVDVRSYPKSKRYPYFNRDVLERTLSARGIKYEWIGWGMGGLEEPTPENWERCKSIVRNVMDRYNGVALVCSESDPKRCHRVKVGERLRREGVCDSVVHVEATRGPAAESHLPLGDA